jgi:hypothetical protein
MLNVSTTAANTSLRAGAPTDAGIEPTAGVAGRRATLVDVAEAIPEYERGPDATVRAAAAASGQLDEARAIIVVEGVSDQIAVDTAAQILGRDLPDDGVIVMPIGGAHAIHRTLLQCRERSPDISIAGLCDAAEQDEFRRAADHAVPDRFRFFVCVADLEDELMRAAGPDLLMRVVEEQGDRRSFATLSAQPQWRGRSFGARFRRFTGAGSGRKLRYAAALARALDAEHLPAPLVDVLAATR